MKQLITTLLILFSGAVYAQNDSIKTIVQADSTKPALILVLKSTTIELDSVSIQKINPEWINKIEVLKEQKYTSLHGDKNGLIYIYPKKKYRKQIAEIIRK